MAYDLVIKNGTIVDGSGAPGFRADLAVGGGRIAEIGRIKEERKKDHRRVGSGRGARIHRSSHSLRRAVVLGLPDDMLVMAWGNHRYYGQLRSRNRTVPARDP